MNTAQERAADYHADLGPEPTLSSTIAATLILKTPAHAKAKHPRLTDHPVVESSYAMNLGTTVHQLLLRDDRVDVVPFDDFRSGEARLLRDASLEVGRVPVTRPMWAQAQEVADAVRQQLQTGPPYVEPIRPVPFTEGQAEYTIRYRDNGANCRAMLDWLRHDRTHIDDLKTTTDAAPAKVRRHIFNMGYDIRAAFYIRAVLAERVDVTGYTEDVRTETLPVTETAPVFRWVFVETKPPYPVTIATLTERALESAHMKVDEAIRVWNQCLETGVWPSYPPEIVEVDNPPWEQDRLGWADVDIEAEAPF